jgi:molecular chaperone HtpG
MDGHLDTHFLNHLETKFKDSRFARVDSDIVEKLIPKEDLEATDLSQEQQNDLSEIFRSQLPQGVNYLVTFENLGEQNNPLIITQAEFTRRMKEMSELGGGGMNFYGGMPDSYNLVVNASHPLVIKVREAKEKSLAKKLQDLDEKLAPLNEEKANLEKEKEGKKEEEIPQELTDKLDDASKKISEIGEKRKKILSEYGGKNKIVRQLIDLALLSNNMLKGEELVRFVKRSVDLIK